MNSVSESIASAPQEYEDLLRKYEADIRKHFEVEHRQDNDIRKLQMQLDYFKEEYKENKKKLKVKDKELANFYTELTEIKSVFQNMQKNNDMLVERYESDKAKIKELEEL